MDAQIRRGETYSSLRNVTLLLGTGVAFTIYCFFAFTVLLSILVAFINKWPYCFPNHPACVATDPVSRIGWSVGKTWFTMIFINTIGLLIPVTTNICTANGQFRRIHPKGHKALMWMAVGMMIAPNIVEWVSVHWLFAAAYLNYLLSGLLTLGSAYLLAEYLIMARGTISQHPAVSYYQEKILNGSALSLITPPPLAEGGRSKSAEEGRKRTLNSKELSKSLRMVLTGGHKPNALSPCKIITTSGEVKMSEEKTNFWSVTMAKAVKTASAVVNRKSSAISPVTIKVQATSHSHHHNEPTAPPAISSAVEATQSSDAEIGIRSSNFDSNDKDESGGTGNKSSPVKRRRPEGEELEPSSLVRSRAEVEKPLPPEMTEKQKETGNNQVETESFAKKKREAGSEVDLKHASKLLKLRRQRRHLTLLIGSSYGMGLVVIVLFMRVVFPLQLYVAEHYHEKLMDILYSSIGMAFFTTGIITFQRYQGYLLYFRGFYDRMDPSKNWFPIVLGLTFVIATGQRVMNLQSNSVVLTTVISGTFNLASLLTVPLRDRLMRVFVYQKKRFTNGRSSLQNEIYDKIVTQFTSFQQVLTLEKYGDENNKPSTDNEIAILNQWTALFSKPNGKVSPENSGKTTTGMQGHAVTPAAPLPSTPERTEKTAIPSSAINTRTYINIKDQSVAISRGQTLSSNATATSIGKKWWEEEEDECEGEELERRKRYAVKSVWIQSTFASIIASFGSIGAGNAIYLFLPAVRAPSTMTTSASTEGQGYIISAGWGWLCTASQLVPFLRSFGLQLGITAALMIALQVLLKQLFHIDIAREWAQDTADVRFRSGSTSDASTPPSYTLWAAVKRKSVFLSIFLLQPIQGCLLLGHWNLSYMLQSEVRGIAESSKGELFPTCPRST